MPPSAAVSLLSRLCENGRPASWSFHLLVVSEEDYPTVETYGHIDELLARLRSLQGGPCYGFPFMGEAWQIVGTPPFTFLRTSYGDLPLFEVPSAAGSSLRPAGWLGGGDRTLLPPSSPRREQDDAATAAEEPARDEEADDDSSELF